MSVKFWYKYINTSNLVESFAIEESDYRITQMMFDLILLIN